MSHTFPRVIINHPLSKYFNDYTHSKKPSSCAWHLGSSTVWAPSMLPILHPSPNIWPNLHSLSERCPRCWDYYRHIRGDRQTKLQYSVVMKTMLSDLNSSMRLTVPLCPVKIHLYFLSFSFNTEYKIHFILCIFLRVDHRLVWGATLICIHFLFPLDANVLGAVEFWLSEKKFNSKSQSLTLSWGTESYGSALVLKVCFLPDIISIT